jgi:hypothetical protein
MAPIIQASLVFRSFSLTLIFPGHAGSPENVVSGWALVNETAIQEDLFASLLPGQDGRAARLMSVMDEINRKSRIKVRSARQAGPAAYTMRSKHLSPAYTTDWNQLPSVT